MTRLLVLACLVGLAAAWVPAGVPCRLASRQSASRVSGIDMKKKLKENTVRQVVLVKDLEALGSKGEIVTVKKAYFRNYLQPYGLAQVATEEVLRAAEEEKAARAAAEAAALEGARQQAATIEAVCGAGAITIMRRAGPDGKLFGTVTAAELAELVEERTGVQVDKKGINVPSINEAGSFVVSIKLHPKVEVTMSILVVGQE